MESVHERPKRGVVIDSGLLLLLLLGNIRPDFVGRHKRLEKYEPADLGLLDAASLVVASGYQLLTDDFPLAQIAHSRGQAVINFNHLRQA